MMGLTAVTRELSIRLLLLTAERGDDADVAL
jgi:hypothetical protein